MTAKTCLARASSPFFTLRYQPSRFLPLKRAMKPGEGATFSFTWAWVDRGRRERMVSMMKWRMVDCGLMGLCNGWIFCESY